MHAKEFVAKTGRGLEGDKKSLGYQTNKKHFFFVFPLTFPLVSLAIYLLHPLHPMYHMIPVLALTSPPIVLFLPYTWYTPCRITNPFLCILIFLLLLYPLYSPSELEDKVSRQRHLPPTFTAMTRKKTETETETENRKQKTENRNCANSGGGLYKQAPNKPDLPNFATSSSWPLRLSLLDVTHTEDLCISSWQPGY